MLREVNFLANKRCNGEGIIFRRKDGRWQAAISITLPNGKRKRIYFYSDTKKECAGWLAEVRHSVQVGRPILDSGILLLDWLRHWLEKYTVNIRDSSRMGYECYIEKHIARHKIAQIPLSKLTTDDLQDFVLFLQKSGKLDGSGGLSAKTIRNLMQMIHKALHQAVGNKLIWSNPADYIQLPKVQLKEVHFLSTEDMEKLLQACAGEAWGIGVVLMMFTGIRAGELQALRHDSLCCENGIYYLDIRSSLQRVTNYSAKQGEAKTILRVSDPKTENSKRKIPLIPEVAAELQRHMEHQRSVAASSYRLYQKYPFIIGNQLGECVDRTCFSKWFRSMVEKSGISGKVTPHVLRHGFGNQALKSGVSIKYISTLLGHYSTDFTARVYIHTDLERVHIKLDKE